MAKAMAMAMAKRIGRCEKLPRTGAHAPRTTPDDDDGVDSSGRRRSFSYRRLPEHPFRLSVLKLDDSFFDVEVRRTASVVELKMEIEKIFNKLAVDGGFSISWSHVWGHFCLCYNEHKLIDDRVLLRTYGVKDGDQLYFIKHVSTDQHLHWRRLKSQRTNFVKHWMSLTQQHPIKEVEDNGKVTHGESIGDEQRSDHCQERCVAVYKQSKLDHFFRRGYTRLGSPHKTNSDQSTKICKIPRKIFWAICC